MLNEFLLINCYIEIKQCYVRTWGHITSYTTTTTVNDNQSGIKKETHPGTTNDNKSRDAGE